MKGRLLAVVGVLLTAGVAGSPAAHATDATLKPTTEAWFAPDPTCALPTGCLLSQIPLPLSPPDPYPAGTVHVGYTAQKETQRAYLAFDLSAFGPLTSARLDIPLDTSVTDGSLAPDTAKVEACLTTDDVTPVADSMATPPGTICDDHVDLTYVATPAPHLTGDLKAIMVGLETTTGIALIPDTSTATATDAWQVVWSAHDRADDTTGPATLTVSDGSTDAAEVSAAPTSAAPAKATPASRTSAPPRVSAPAQAPPVVTLPQVTVPVAAPASEAAPEVAPVPAQVIAAPAPAAAVTGSDGVFRHPEVLLLPLALILLVPTAARALTRDLDPDEGDL